MQKKENSYPVLVGCTSISTGTAAMITHAPQILKTEVPPSTAMPALEMCHDTCTPALTAGPFAIADTESA